jgi:hypothetical protein
VSRKQRRGPAAERSDGDPTGGVRKAQKESPPQGGFTLCTLGPFIYAPVAGGCLIFRPRRRAVEVRERQQRISKAQLGEVNFLGRAAADDSDKGQGLFDQEVELLLPRIDNKRPHY